MSRGQKDEADVADRFGSTVACKVRITLQPWKDTIGLGVSRLGANNEADVTQKHEHNLEREARVQALAGMEGMVLRSRLMWRRVARVFFSSYIFQYSFLHFILIVFGWEIT